MENVKKNKLLLVAVILGVLSLIFLACLAYLEHGLINGTFWIENSKTNLLSLGMTGTFDKSYPDILVWLIILLIINIAAIALNILGWLKNKNKNVLISGILYVLGLNLFSAIFCFISYKKNRKAE